MVTNSAGLSPGIAGRIPVLTTLGTSRRECPGYIICTEVSLLSIHHRIFKMKCALPTGYNGKTVYISLVTPNRRYTDYFRRHVPMRSHFSQCYYVGLWTRNRKVCDHSCKIFLHLETVRQTKHFTKIFSVFKSRCQISSLCKYAIPLQISAAIETI